MQSSSGQWSSQAKGSADKVSGLVPPTIFRESKKRQLEQMTGYQRDNEESALFKKKLKRPSPKPGSSQTELIGMLNAISLEQRKFHDPQARVKNPFKDVILRNTQDSQLSRSGMKQPQQVPQNQATRRSTVGTIKFGEFTARPVPKSQYERPSKNKELKMMQDSMWLQKQAKKAMVAEKLKIASNKENDPTPAVRQLNATSGNKVMDFNMSGKTRKTLNLLTKESQGFGGTLVENKTQVNRNRSERQFDSKPDSVFGFPEKTESQQLIQTPSSGVARFDFLSYWKKNGQDQ